MLAATWSRLRQRLQFRFAEHQAFDLLQVVFVVRHKVVLSTIVAVDHREGHTHYTLGQAVLEGRAGDLDTPMISAFLPARLTTNTC